MQEHIYTLPGQSPEEVRPCVTAKVSAIKKLEKEQVAKYSDAIFEVQLPFWPLEEYSTNNQTVMDNILPITGPTSYEAMFVFGDVEHALDFYASPVLPIQARHSIDWTVPTNQGLHHSSTLHPRAHSTDGSALLPLLLEQPELQNSCRQTTQSTSMVPAQSAKPTPASLRPGESSVSNSSNETPHGSEDQTDHDGREKRRAQNRYAQRLYRKRKEQSLHEREREIGDLKQQLERERSVNRSLSKVIDCLRLSLTTGAALPNDLDDISKPDWSRNSSQVNVGEDRL